MEVFQLLHIPLLGLLVDLPVPFFFIVVSALLLLQVVMVQILLRLKSKSCLVPLHLCIAQGVIQQLCMSFLFNLVLVLSSLKISQELFVSLGQCL